MFSQDFFLAIILQDSSPGEGGHDVGWGWQGGQSWRKHELDHRMWGDDVPVCHRCVVCEHVHKMFACICKGLGARSAVSAYTWQRLTYVVCLRVHSECGTCTCVEGHCGCGLCTYVWPGWFMYIYLPMCVHASVHGVCISIWLELVCMFAHFLCVHTLVFVVSAQVWSRARVSVCTRVCRSW